MTPTDLKIGDVLTNSQLSDVYKVDSLRGIRISKKFETIVVIARYTEAELGSFWEGNVFYYNAAPVPENSPQKLEFGVNARLLNAEQNGMKIVVFECYSRNQYTYRGRVAMLGVEDIHEYGANGILQINRYFRLRPIRHLSPSEAAASRLTLVIDLMIWNDEAYFHEYLIEQVFGRIEVGLSYENRYRLFSSCWRAYASNVVEVFLTKFESLVPGIVAYEFDLEKGSIGAKISLCAVTMAAVVGMIGDYPDAKKNWPELKADVGQALDQAKLELQLKFNNIRIELDTRLDERSRQGTLYPSLGPIPNVLLSNRRRRGEDNIEES